MKTHYSIFVAGRPFISLSDLRAVAAVVADIRINSGPDVQIQIFRNDVTEITPEILSKSNDQCLDWVGNPNSVE